MRDSLFTFAPSCRDESEPKNSIQNLMNAAPGSEFPRQGTGQILEESSSFGGDVPMEGVQNYAASSAAVPPANGGMAL